MQSAYIREEPKGIVARPNRPAKTTYLGVALAWNATLKYVVLAR